MKDGLGDREAAAGFKDAKTFNQRRPLVGNVGEDRAGCHDIDRRIGDPLEVVGRASKERALRPHVTLHGDGFCIPQHGSGYVGENDAQRRTDTIDGTERHQTFAGTDIDQSHAVGKLRTLQHPIRVTLNDGLDDLGVRRIVRVTTMQEPFGPDVRLEVVLFHYVVCHAMTL